MNKPHPSTTPQEETGALDLLMPVQETLERCRLASERLNTVCSEIVARDFAILQKSFYETLGDMQGLSPLHGPVEFLEQGAILSWRNAERSIKTFSELGTEFSRFWFDTMKAASNAAPRQKKNHPPH